MAKSNKSGGVRNVQGAKVETPSKPYKRATGGRDLFGMLGQRLGADLNTDSGRNRYRGKLGSVPFGLTAFRPLNNYAALETGSPKIPGEQMPDYNYPNLPGQNLREPSFIQDPTDSADNPVFEDPPWWGPGGVLDPSDNMQGWDKFEGQGAVPPFNPGEQSPGYNYPNLPGSKDEGDPFDDWGLPDLDDREEKAAKCAAGQFEFCY